MTRRLILATVLASALVAACSKDSATPDTNATSSSSKPTTTASGSAATGSSTGVAATTAAATGAVPPAASSGAAAATTTAAAAAANTVAPAAPGGDVTYTPFKHPKGFSLDVPSLFTAVTTKNPDSQTWSYGTATIKTDVSPNIGDTIDEAFNSDVSGTPGVTDKLKKDNWYMLKGSSKGKSFYKKIFVSAQTMTNLQIQYDDAQKAQLDPVAQHIGDSFKPKS